MKKLYFTLTLISSLLIATSAFAKGISVAQDENKITVSYSGEATERTSFVVVKDGHTLDDIDYIVAIKESIPAANGIATCEFLMPETLMGESAYGKYTVCANQGTIEKDSFLYATSDLVLQWINNATSKDELADYIRDLEFDGTKFSELDDKSAREWALTQIFENKPYASTEGIRDQYQKSMALYTINNDRFSNLAENLKKYADILGIENNSTYKSYLSKSNSGKINEAIQQSLTKSQPTTTTELLNIISNVLSSNQSKTTGGGGGGGSSSGGGGVILNQKNNTQGASITLTTSFGCSIVIYYENGVISKYEIKRGNA